MDEDDPGYQRYLDDAAEKCRCCPNCWQRPCEGALGGGFCDHMRCRCDDEDDMDWEDYDE